MHPLCDEAIRIIDARRGSKSKYVFPAKGKKNVPTGDCKKLWAGILKEAGVTDCHIHDLRHTNATYQLRAGVDIATVSEMLGHRDISITKRVYAHVMNDSKRKAANAAAAAMLHPEG